MFALTTASRYLLGRRLRTGLTTLAVVFGVFVLFGMNVILPSFIKAFQANMLAASNQVDASITHRTGESFPLAVLDRVADTPGIVAAAASLNRPVNLPADFYDRDPRRPDAVTVLSILGVDLTPERSIRSVRAVQVSEGRFLEPGDMDAAVISASLAEALGLHLGDVLALPGAAGRMELTVVGLRPAHTLPGNEEVLVSLPEAQRLFDLPGRINLVEASFGTAPDSDRALIAARLEAALGPDFMLGALPAGSDFLGVIRIGQAVISLFGVMALVMGGFIIFNTFRTVVAERKRDLGLLRAVGASRRTILGLILAEGLLQGIIGTALGMLLGYLFGAGLLGLTGDLMEQFVHIRVAGPAVSFGLVVITITLGIGVTLLSGLLPALAASRLTPLEALRPSAAVVERRAAGRGAILGSALVLLAVLGLVSGLDVLAGLGAAFFMVGLMLLAPVLVQPVAAVLGGLAARIIARDGVGDLAQGSLSRQPTRAAITASTTMTALAIIVAVAGVVATVRGTFLTLLQGSLGSDYLLVPPAVAVWGNNVGAGGALADGLRALAGVEVVSTLRFAAGAAGETPISLLGLDPAVFPAVSRLQFERGEAAAAYAALADGRGLIANGLLATTLRLQVGDELTLSTPAGPQIYTVAAVANDFLNAKVVTAWVSQAAMAADFGKTEDVFLQVNLAPGADPAEVEPRLAAIITAYPQFQLISGADYLAENTLLFEQAFLGMYVLFIVLAVPSLIAMLNSLAIGVIERTREIGMLRAVGTTRRQLWRLIITEALLLATIGTGLGLLAGLYLGYVLVKAMAVGGFTLPYTFPLAGLLAAVAVGLLSGVGAALLPARRAASLSVVQALRYE